MTLSPFAVGCDISKLTIDFHDNSTGQHTRVENTVAAIDDYLEAYCGLGYHFAFEATGVYGLILRQCLQARGLVAVQINALHARRFAQSRGRLAKTDRVDAAQLAQMAECLALPETVPFCQSSHDLKELITRRDQLVEARASEMKRELQVSLDAVQQDIAATIEHLTASLKTVEQMIADMIESNKELQERNQLLQTVPGIGPRVAAVLLAGLPEAGSIGQKAVASLAGVAPMANDSGARHGKRYIQGGRPGIRKALYMAALNACRSEDRFGLKYREMRQHGKPAKVAIIAIARKIIVTVNAMLKNNQAFQ